MTLCHGFPEQENYELFKEQVFLGDWARSSFDQIKFINATKRWLTQHSHEFDVMHSISGYHLSMAPSFHAEKLGLPTAVFISNHQVQLGESAGWRRWFQLHKKRQSMARKMSALVSMSGAIRQELLGYGVSEDRIVDIPMGVNTSVFFPSASIKEKSELRKNLGLKDVPTLLFVGTVVKRKRPDLLVKAIAILKKEGIDCQLVVCGPEKEPDYARQMKEFAMTEGISDRVIWTGFSVDVSPYYRIADYYCLPSSNEGMAASLVEAMASCLVPIVTPVSGSTDLVKNGLNGSHINADKGEIAAVIRHYIENPVVAEKHSQAAYKLVKEKYTDSVVYGKYMAMYKRLASGRSLKV